MCFSIREQTLSGSYSDDCQQALPSGDCGLCKPLLLSNVLLTNRIPQCWGDTTSMIRITYDFNFCLALRLSLLTSQRGLWGSWSCNPQETICCQQTRETGNGFFTSQTVTWDMLPTNTWDWKWILHQSDCHMRSITCQCHNTDSSLIRNHAAVGTTEWSPAFWLIESVNNKCGTKSPSTDEQMRKMWYIYIIQWNTTQPQKQMK